MANSPRVACLLLATLQKSGCSSELIRKPGIARFLCLRLLDLDRLSNSLQLILGLPRPGNDGGVALIRTESFPHCYIDLLHRGRCIVTFVEKVAVVQSLSMGPCVAVNGFFDCTRGWRGQRDHERQQQTELVHGDFIQRTTRADRRTSATDRRSAARCRTVAFSVVRAIRAIRW
jgi:hypothetical protein